MPLKFVRPCIPTTAKAIPQGDAWLHEPKLDGYRFQIVKDGERLRLFSRRAFAACLRDRWRTRLPTRARAPDFPSSALRSVISSVLTNGATRQNVSI